MSDEPRPEPTPESTPEPTLESGRDVLTGHPVVDEVLADLRDLGERPVAEHVEVFESAHERLRDALAGAGDGAADRPSPAGPA